MEMRLYAMTTGLLRLDKGWLCLAGMGESYTSQMPVFLITHPKGNVLVDTGARAAVAKDAAKEWGPTAQAFEPIYEEGEDVVSLLEKIDFSPKDIKYVVNTHLHLDHAGGNQYFPNATFLVQRDELRYANWPDPHYRGGYFRADFDHPLSYFELDGDLDVFGDGRVVLFRTIGHTPGHQSVVVRLPKTGTLVLAGDACFLQASIENNVIPGLVWRSDEVMRSYQRLRELQMKESARLIYGHDYRQWGELPHPPQYYE